LGRSKPRTVDHLMSLANEWVDGEDSIANPRNRRRSLDDGTEAKDQHHSGSRRVRQKGHRGCYEDDDTANMVAVGYVNHDHDNNRDGPRQGTRTMEVAARAPGTIRGKGRSGVDVVISHHPQRRTPQQGGVLSTPTSTKMVGEN
jgi:hypothetical protein